MRKMPIAGICSTAGGVHALAAGPNEMPKRGLSESDLMAKSTRVKLSQTGMRHALRSESSGWVRVRVRVRVRVGVRVRVRMRVRVRVKGEG